MYADSLELSVLWAFYAIVWASYSAEEAIKLELFAQTVESL